MNHSSFIPPSRMIAQKRSRDLRDILPAASLGILLWFYEKNDE